MRALAFSRSNNKRTTSSFEDFSTLDILDQPAFVKMLHVEQMRAERSHRPFALMLVQFDRYLTDSTHKFLIEQLVTTLAKSIRQTDILGWHDTATLGILFTELGGAEKPAVIAALLSKLNAALSSTLTREEIVHVGVSLYILPEDSSTDKEQRFLTDTCRLDETRDKSETNLPLRVKRLMDIAGSAFTLLFLSPLFVAIAILVKCTSPGPVFYRQIRVGHYGRKFTFLKFRSMHFADHHSIHEEFVKRLIVSDGTTNRRSDAPANVYKITNDPRVTAVGAFLRKTSLDELPQLLNVLQGEMSLVGPRPPIPYEVKYYDTWHRRRLLTKPGITGLWQVTGRSRVGFDDMVRLDLKYATSWSLWLDIKILLRTPRAVLGGEGAY